MPIPTTIADLSTTPASNSPQGSESPTQGDDYLRAIQAVMKSEFSAPTSLSFTQSGTGSTSRTVQSKLREVATITDFGAVSAAADVASTVATSTVAFREVELPAGTWNIVTTPTITGNTQLVAGPGAVVSGAGATALGFTANAQHQRIQHNTASTDFATSYIRRNANHSGGAAGFTSSCVRIDTYVTNALATNYEWALTATMNNSATGGQNVGAYLLGNRNTTTTGPTWGAVIDLEETVPINDPASGSVGLEVDNRSNGTDANNARIGVDVACTRRNTAGVATTASYGVRVQTNRDGANSVVKIAYGIDGPSTNVQIGFDASIATISQAAFKMAQGQNFALNSAATRLISYDGAGINFGNGSTIFFRMNDTNTLQIGGSQVLQGRVNGWGAGTLGSRAAFNGSTATLAQTSAAVAQLIADLTTHGLIGA